MAGPEPYPQEKWTIEQERAYAEGRESARGSSGKGSASRSGTGRKRSGRKRYVRTAAGEKRYKVPIGSEIGTARNAKAAEAQKDTESTGRYEELVGSDPTAQAKAMRGLSDDQLQRLSRVAYSFRSSDQNVVRLRIGVANELRRRGMNVNDFGGLGGGGKSGGKLKATPSAGSTQGVQAAMAKMYGRNRELSVPQLRKMVGVFSRVAPDKREKVARFLVNRAVELSAPHLLGQSIIEAANLPDQTRTKIVELAGKWRHGWIPLDATAMSSKLKGGNGKPWWGAGKQRKRGNVASMRKSVNAARGGKTGVRKSGISTKEAPQFAAKQRSVPGSVGKPDSMRLPSTADEELRDALGDGMDKSAVHRSSSGSWAVDNGDGSWSIFNSKGHLRTDEARKSQLPKDAWPSVHRTSGKE